MRRCSLLFSALSGCLLYAGCLVQDPAWEPPAETDGLPPTDGPQSSSEGTSAVSSETGANTDGATGAVPGDELPIDCLPLPDIPADAIIVSPADNPSLDTVFSEAAPNTTIALEPGTYDRAGQPALVLSADGVTVRSTTGDPDDVVLTGGSSETAALVSVQASDVLLAEFTIQDSSEVLVEIGVEDVVLQRPRIYRMVLRDSLRTKLSVGNGVARWTDDGEVACSTFARSDTFRENLTDCGGASALRISGGARWSVRDNLIEGHWCSTFSFATLAVDRGSRDTVVERNILRNNFRGILLGGDNIDAGRPEPADDTCGVPDGPSWGHIRGVVVNNLTWVDDPAMAGAIPGLGTDLDSMLGLWHACGAVAVHNTSYVTLTTFNGIEWRYPDTTATIANNLVSTELASRNGALALGVDTNVIGVDASEFIDAAGGDFRLAASSTAIDAGIVIPAVLVPEDFNRNKRTDQPDLGAFETQP
ncbi:MAG: hypothetical protein ACRBN8_14375 [Nannocystales bacterium]